MKKGRDNRLSLFSFLYSGKAALTNFAARQN